MFQRPNCHGVIGFRGQGGFKKRERERAKKRDRERARDIERDRERERERKSEHRIFEYIVKMSFECSRDTFN